MAKIRKQKTGEQRYQALSESVRQTCAIVRHEKLCLRVDVASHRLHGYAELKVVAPTTGVVGLHAQGLNIVRVLYDGTPTEYEVLHSFQSKQFETASCMVQNLPAPSVLEAAESAYTEYLGSLSKELCPELLIFVPEASIASDENHDVPQAISGTGSNGISVPPPEMAEPEPTKEPETVKENRKEQPVSHPEEKVTTVHVEYWLENPDAGGHFFGNMFHTNGQLRRARCWFPCVDLEFQRCSYNMEFTVDSEYVAVSCGKLQYQVINKDDEHLKTFVYSLDIPVPARCIALVVAPLEVHPDHQNGSISHFCFPGKAFELQCTVNFFHSVFSYYEEYLGSSFPFGSYSHVFLESEFLTASVTTGAAMTILSSHLLVDDRIIDQTMNTRIKLAHALAQQWFGLYIAPESPDDAWLLEGLCSFLTDLFIKRHFGNNESYYRRFKANEAVCKVDIEDAPPLSPKMNLFGTQKIGFLGNIYSWKSIAVIQMLEKQMGPEAFRKILQRVILRAQDPVRNSRTLSTKEFRHFANRLGNLERPFLKEFFPRWVESSGCPVLRMGFEYSKRRNVIELAVHRECTAVYDLENIVEQKDETMSEQRRAVDVGWPGMMSIRVHEIDGMYDHPVLSMAGDAYQLLEIQCHSKMAGRRIQQKKKTTKADGVEDMEITQAADPRLSIESPLLWLRADPQMEYLAEIDLHQPEQMWINQLERDKDVGAQLQAIAALVSLSEMSFVASNALTNCLADSKAYYRVRVEAACALAGAAREANGGTQLSQILAFYKGIRYDPDIGLPRPNDFHDFSDYFVLQAIPDAVSTVVAPDGRSPSEAVEFILQLLKHNDNSGNHYSDVFWLASIVKSIGKLEFGKQSFEALSRMLKHIDRLLQSDRIMPSYNHLLTVSCIETLTKLALKFSSLVPLENLKRLLNPYRDTGSMTVKVRAVVLQALLKLEIHEKGLDAGINLVVELINMDCCLRVQTKLLEYILHVAILLEDTKRLVQGSTLSRLMLMLNSKKGFNNTVMRHHIFCILQVLAGRPGTLFRVGRTIVHKPIKPLEEVSVQVIPPTQAMVPQVKVAPSYIKLRIQQPEVPQEPATHGDKLNDPEYREKKKLKKDKEKREPQKQMQIQPQPLPQPQKQELPEQQSQEHGQELHEDTDKSVELDAAKASSDSLQTKPATVLRIKLKKMSQPPQEKSQEEQQQQQQREPEMRDESDANVVDQVPPKSGSEFSQPKPGDRTLKLKIKKTS